MIDVSNLKDALKTLGFVAYGDIYEKVFFEIGCSLKVDFQAKRLIYPNEIKGRERNDGFDQKENFVVFECVCRLLSKGYRPEHIELEKEWHLGHDAKGGRADICVSDTSGNMLFIIECKTWGREYDKALNNTKSDGAQLFSYWQQEQSCKWLVLYASDLRSGCIAYKAPTIDCSDDANIILLSKKDKSIKLYRDAHTTSAKYEAWKETYGSQIHDDLIFSEDSVAYQIGVKPLRKKDLRDFTPDDKIVNKFEEILRHNNVSDKEKDEYSSDEYLQIPQMFYYSLGENKEEYYTFVKAQLHSSPMLPNVIHREMLNLNPVSFITTNYDTLLEDAAVQYCQSFKVVSRDEDVPTIFGDRFILKLHGDFKHNNFVLKEEDYLNYSDNFKLIETLVKSIFSTNTVVFIGYSLNDYNIKLILNWTKTLLKDSFREPIFLYVGSQALTDTEIIYHQSKGLLVIEWNKLIASTDVYLDRYTAIFAALKNQSELSLDGKSEDDAFEILYNLLQPLGCLNALRIEDVSKRLYPYVIIGDDGVIRLSNNDSLLLKKFFTINQLSEGEQDNLTKTMLEKYRCILDVFRKARMLEVEDGHKYRRFVAGEVPFADKNCILFDYSAMCTFSTKNYKTLERNYKKAFYLSRLRRYDEAFFHFSEVAKQAFKESNYLMYYFAESNCISLRKVIKNVNTWYRCYNLDAIEALSPNDLEAENLFRRLPVEFRNTYDNLRDIHSANMLYKYSYEAFADGQKLQKVIESGTTEFGMTSSGKAICRVNDYLHFLLGNGIVADVFSEYRNAVKNLMSLLVYKYSIQGKKVLHEQPFPFIGGNDVHFDEIDFHCFIEYFDAKEISALLKKHHIETIAFQNMDLVETAVKNLLDYYSSAVRATKNNIDVIGLQTQIKNCLVLLGYVNISQGLVDKICSFILTQEFREILIDDKILFLDRQLERRKMYSKETSRIVENTLISYLDRNISASKNGERFEVLSRNTGINYCNLVHYIFAPGEKHFSRRLAARVSQIINNNLFQMNRQITQHYYGYVSNNQQKKLITWANKQSRTNFSFDLFEMLVQCDARISKAAKTQLKIFLRQRIDAAQENNNNGIVVYPNKHPYEELDQVGYWCLINVLNAKDFREFLGNSAAFDFYCEYTKFDFNKFDVSWLLNLYPHTLEQIAKNEKAKGCVRVAIADALNDGEIALSDSQRLQSILIKHFC